MRFHCPKCSRFVSKVEAREHGPLLGKGSYNPYYAWDVFGTCSVHGEQILEDHGGDEGCGCALIGYAECWWDMDSDY